MSLKKLNERDSRAVDAILMNGRDMNSVVPLIAVADDGVSPEAFKAASTVLHLLDACSADEPPDDLARRTIERLGRPGTFGTSDRDRPSPSGPKPS